MILLPPAGVCGSARNRDLDREWGVLEEIMTFSRTHTSPRMREDKQEDKPSGFLDPGRESRKGGGGGSGGE